MPLARPCLRPKGCGPEILHAPRRPVRERRVVAQNFIPFQAEAEALSIAMACPVHQAHAAVAALMELPAYQAALETMHLQNVADYLPYRHPAVDPLTLAAEQAVLNPIYNGILIKAQLNGWE